MFAIVDLFWNVPEFDRVRPRSTAYRSMRYAAHGLVGEPYLDGDFREDFPPLGLAGATRELMATAVDGRVPEAERLAAIDELEAIADTSAYAALRAVCDVESRIVARRAWLARARVEQRFRERSGASRAPRASGG